MAVQAALTGHLVLSTLHTNDAASAVTRLLELGVPYYLIRSTLIGVVAQRLIRTLCPHCVEQVPTDDAMREEWRSLMAPWKAEAPASMARPVGCLECRQSGFLGRAGIYELLSLTPGVKERISATAHLEEIRKQAFRDGMRPLRVSGLGKVAQGKTTAAEILKVTPAPLLE